MNEEKAKVFNVKTWFLNNSALFITSMIPVLAGIVTLFGSIYKRMYLERYYQYFNIDMRYVSVGYYWKFSDIAVDSISLFASFLPVYMIYLGIIEMNNAWNNYKMLKNDESVHSRVKKYYKWKTVRQAVVIIILIALAVYCICCIEILFYGPSYDDFGNPLLLNEMFYTAWRNFKNTVIVFFFVMLVIVEIEFLIRKDARKRKPQSENGLEKDYKKIFHAEYKDDAFKEQQMNAIKKYYDEFSTQEKEFDRKQTPVLRTVGILAVCLFFLSQNINSGQSDAINQKDFLQ